jgi:hypothetical protein
MKLLICPRCLSGERCRLKNEQTWPKSRKKMSNEPKITTPEQAVERLRELHRLMPPSVFGEIADVVEALKTEVEGLRRILHLRKKTASETMLGLINMVDNAETAKQMSCAELSEALRRKIGDQTPMDKLEYDLIEEAAGRLEFLLDQSDIDKAVMDAVDLKRQRDALLEMTWLDMPSEPTESIAQWRRLFEEGWERRPGPQEPVDDVQDDSESIARLRYLEGRDPSGFDTAL